MTTHDRWQVYLDRKGEPCCRDGHPTYAEAMEHKEQRLRQIAEQRAKEEKRR